MTLKHKNVGFEILVRDGSDLLKMLGQAPNVNGLTDLTMAPVMPLTYDFLPPSDYLTKPWRQSALIASGMVDDGAGEGNDFIYMQIYIYNSGTSGTFSTTNAYVSFHCLDDAVATSISTYLTWLNNAFAGTIEAAKLAKNSADTTDVSLRFNATADGKIRITCKRVKIQLWSTLTSTQKSSTWIISEFGLTGNVDSAGQLTFGDSSTDAKQLTSASPANIVKMQRVLGNQNDFIITVGQDTASYYAIDASVNKDYPNQGAFVTELNTQIGANALLKAALKAVGGSVRFNLVAATATVPEHISLTVFMADVYMYSTGSILSTDIIRLLGKNFTNSDGSFNFRHDSTWLHAVTFDNPSPLMQMPRSLYIYLPDLIADANVGGYETTLLRCVQMVGDLGTVQTYEPQYIQWHDITASGMRLGQIHVVLRNAFGEVVQFEWGSITVTIQFRPIMAAIIGA